MWAVYTLLPKRAISNLWGTQLVPIRWISRWIDRARGRNPDTDRDIGK